MDSFSTLSLSWLYTSFLFLLFIHTAISSTPDALYNDHCSSIVPKSRPTSRVYSDSGNHVPKLLRTSYLVGADNLLGTRHSNHSFLRKTLRFSVNPNSVDETVDKSTYSIEGYLTIRYMYPYSRGSNSSYGSYYHKGSSSSSIRFRLRGFWSTLSKKLCMVGSGSGRVEGQQALNLDAVLKLRFASDNPTMYTSVESGTLESMDPADDSRYFDPISIFSFPEINNYDYSLVSGELGDGVLDGGDLGFPKNETLVLEQSSFCKKISAGGGSYAFELVYASECNGSKHCSPLGADGGFLPHSVDLYPIQCSRVERKVRYMVTFHNTAFYSSFYGDFRLNSTFLAEGSWDDKHNRIVVVACRLLNPDVYSGNVVGDCSLRLSLRYRSVWTIRKSEQIVGQIWTNKSIDESGYFEKAKLTSYGNNGMLDYSGLRYEYTELDKARKLCVAKVLVKKKGAIYPDGHSYDMSFDMSVKSSKGKQFAWGYANPLFVGNETFERNSALIAMSPESYESFSTISAPVRSSNPTVNISYKLSINFFRMMKGFSTGFIALNSSYRQGRVVIDAEGMYNTETGQLCMVGCRKLKNESLDCDILININFAPLNERSGSSVIKGTIRSTRTKGDALYFEDLSVSSSAFYREAAKRSIWRMDLEIMMVLISNTLICILLGVQIFHVKRNPEVLSGISLLMLMVLALGLVIPLVLNFEALFSNSHDKQRLWLSTGGWIEANEVTLRIITMVAFLLQIRLFQLVWSAKYHNESEISSWTCEKKAILVSVLVYIFGGLGTLLLNWIRNIYGHQKYFVLADLRSYFGLILDGFLFPQIILNAVRGSAEKSLAHSFYIGTSVVRIVPHAYDQYRANNYPASHVNGTYYYADHATDLYSTAWDVIIPCGVVVLSVIVFFQQRRGGRCIIPNKFGELELYEKVDVDDNQ